MDCGLFQGRRAETYQKNREFRCDPKRLDGVILSHAHIDHCGNLPALYRAGFRGPIFCTPATADVADIMLQDSARIQEEDARYLGKHLHKAHPPIEPLYTVEDVAKTVARFEPLQYDHWHELGEGFRLRFSDAGHILGSAITEMEITERGEVRRVVFTGDLGRRHLPLLHSPRLVDGCDVLISESTYGNRVHPDPGDLQQELKRILHETYTLEGRVVIPAFSLGRTQQVIYFLNELSNAQQLPPMPVFVDSPLSRSITRVYRRHKEILNDNVAQLLETDNDPFGFHGMQFVATQAESIALNRRQGPFVVIAASGMCENGRIRHHLKHAVSDPNSTIVIIGFQAYNTLGRRLVERRPYVRIFDREYPLKARVETLNGLSAHADAEDFKWWYKHMAATGGIGQAFLVHGEPESSQALAELIRDDCNTDPILPQQFDTFEI